ncbi:MAG: methyltransferase domain-containing protein [Pirellulales bacterium]|nr:methyltransferase domain-containing protein [Pirellulales bacterium]
MKFSIQGNQVLPRISFFSRRRNSPEPVPEEEKAVPPEFSFRVDELLGDAVSSQDFLLNIARKIALGASAQIRPCKKPLHNYLGDDLDPEKVEQIANFCRGKASGLAPEAEAQLHELAFWRWVAFEGYADNDPRAFPWLQCLSMLEHYFKTGWTLRELAGAHIVEIGCGPLGMIEFLPGKRKVGFDPLNAEYEKLFRRVRTGGVEYVPDLEALCQTGRRQFDLAVCFNVLDHTTRPRKLLDDYMSLLKREGRFLFQVNTIKPGETRPEDHARMHPSPITEAQIRSWLDQYSTHYQSSLSDKPSDVNEYFFMAWGQKNREPAAPFDESTLT